MRTLTWAPPTHVYPGTSKSRPVLPSKLYLTVTNPSYWASHSSKVSPTSWRTISASPAVSNSFSTAARRSNSAASKACSSASTCAVTSSSVGPPSELDLASEEVCAWALARRLATLASIDARNCASKDCSGSATTSSPSTIDTSVKVLLAGSSSLTGIQTMAPNTTT